MSIQVAPYSGTRSYSPRRRFPISSTSFGDGHGAMCEVGSCPSDCHSCSVPATALPHFSVKVALLVYSVFCRVWKMAALKLARVAKQAPPAYRYGVSPGTRHSFDSKYEFAKSGPFVQLLFTSGSQRNPPPVWQLGPAEAISLRVDLRPGKTIVFESQRLLCPRQFLQPPYTSKLLWRVACDV